MPRIRNTRTGVVTVVDDETAANLGAGYEPAEKPAARQSTAKKAAPAKSGK